MAGETNSSIKKRVSVYPWIKVFTESLHDPKIAMLDDSVWRLFFELCMLAGTTSKRDGRLPGIKEIAFALHKSVSMIEPLMNALAEHRLVVEMPDHTWLVLNFKEQQAAMTDAERQARMRARRRLEQLGKVDEEFERLMYGETGYACEILTECVDMALEPVTQTVIECDEMCEADLPAVPEPDIPPFEFGEASTTTNVQVHLASAANTEGKPKKKGGRKISDGEHVVLNVYYDSLEGVKGGADRKTHTRHMKTLGSRWLDPLDDIIEAAGGDLSLASMRIAWMVRTHHAKNLSFNDINSLMYLHAEAIGQVKTVGVQTSKRVATTGRA